MLYSPSMVITIGLFTIRSPLHLLLSLRNMTEWLHHVYSICVAFYVLISTTLWKEKGAKIDSLPNPIDFRFSWRSNKALFTCIWKIITFLHLLLSQKHSNLALFNCFLVLITLTHKLPEKSYFHSSSSCQWTKRTKSNPSRKCFQFSTMASFRLKAAYRHAVLHPILPEWLLHAKLAQTDLWRHFHCAHVGGCCD